MSTSAIPLPSCGLGKHLQLSVYLPHLYSGADNSAYLLRCRWWGLKEIIDRVARLHMLNPFFHKQTLKVQRGSDVLRDTQQGRATLGGVAIRGKHKRLMKRSWPSCPLHLQTVGVTEEWDTG